MTVRIAVTVTVKSYGYGDGYGDGCGDNALVCLSFCSACPEAREAGAPALPGAWLRSIEAVSVLLFRARKKGKKNKSREINRPGRPAGLVCLVTVLQTISSTVAAVVSVISVQPIKIKGFCRSANVCTCKVRHGGLISVRRRRTVSSAVSDAEAPVHFHSHA